MLGRGSSSTVDRVKGSAAEVGSRVGDRAAETVSELAERAAEIAVRAADAAREAARTAEPVIRTAAATAAERAGEAAREARKQAEPVLRSAAERAAEQLSDVAERAAEVLSDTAERLAQQGAEKGTEAQLAAREKLADAAQTLAEQVRPRKRRRGRRVLLIGIAAGGTVALVMSPVGQKLRAMISGKREEASEPASIPLPVQQQPPTSSVESAATAPGPAASTPGQPGETAQGNGVLAGRPVPPKGAEEAPTES